MDYIGNAVAKLAEVSKGTGVEDGTVILSTDPDETICQYERGVCMTATFGGRTAEFVTDDPLSARTRVGFMFGAELSTPRVRAAASAIVGVVTGFLVINRVLKSCLPDKHVPCLNELSREVQGKSMFCIGDIRTVPERFGRLVVSSPDSADVILVTGAGMCTDDGIALIEQFRGKKRMIFLGPSPSGVCALEKCEHWCPYGRM